jgi:hypothetical protein
MENKAVNWRSRRFFRHSRRQNSAAQTVFKTTGEIHSGMAEIMGCINQGVYRSFRPVFE